MKKLIILLLCLLLTLSVHSQSWKAEADSLMVNHLAANYLGQADIFAFPEMLSSADTIYLSDGTILPVPYTSCYGYFIDMQPFANWSHPCKYCFINASMRFDIVSANMPPLNNDMIGLSLYPRLNPNPTPIVTDTTFVRNCKSSDTSHKWAVLICANGSEKRFWFDLSSVYTTLTNVYGYQEGSIYDDYINRRIIVTAPETIRDLFKDTLYSSDLNGNGNNINGDFFNWSSSDEFTWHTKDNINNIFRCFAGDSQCPQEYNTEQGLRTLTEEDQLFIFITGHGEIDAQGTYFPVKETYGNPTKIHDFEFVGWLRNIKCSQMTLVMENCHSGGFVEQFMQDISRPDCLCKNRVGQSAASADGISRAENYGVYVESTRDIGDDPLANEFTYYWTSAALGYYPYYKTGFHNSNQIVEKGPWTSNSRIIGSGNMNWRDYFGNYENTHPHAQYDVNPDTDNDSVFSFNEFFEFANNLDTWSRQGYYYPNHNDTLGQQFDPGYVPDFPQQRYESTFTIEAATLAGYEGQIDSITDSGTATQPYRLCGDIWVGSDAILTMHDEIQSPKGVKIYIKPTGRMILDGGTLRNLPEDGSPMWQGIEVWGNSDMHQYAVNGNYYQGYLELKNGAVIENAETAVTLWRPEYYSTTGGIIHATDATFLNNAMAFRAVWYKNYNPSTQTEQLYNGYFDNCDFVVDTNYFGTVTCYRHVDLAHVNGIRFSGCRFSAIRQTPGVSYSCIGILANQARFTVNGYCPQGLPRPCPEDSLVRSSFYGFHTGIYAANDGNGTRTFLVRDSDFLSNGRGIYALNTGYATILNNHFVIGCGSDCHFGIYAERVTGFCIEKNSFVPRHNTGCLSYGIAIDNSQGINDIFLNEFSNLTCANVAIGENVSVTNPTTPSFNKGLTYTCNDNTHEFSNMIDFCVLKDEEANYSGIQQSQGSPSIAAGNTFGGTQYHFFNDGDYSVNYYYNSNQLDQIPNPSKIYNVSISDKTNSNSCITHYDDRIVLSEEEKASRENDYLSARTAYNSLKQIYEHRIDGGNTAAEVSDITNATSSDMWTLRAQLLGHSPYLSQEVLTAAADRDDVFTDPVLFEILAANPDELKKDTLISYLENKDNPLPDYMIGLLRQIANGTTARTALEAQMAKYGHDYMLAAGDIVRSNLNDSTANPAELRAWLAAMEDIESDRMAVASYIQEGDFTSAIALANMFPSLYGLQGRDLVDHTDYMRLLGLYQTLDTTGRTVFEMTDAETEMVEEIADEGTGTSQAMAEALLSSVMENRIRYSSCPELPLEKEGDRGIGNYTDAVVNEAVGFNVSLSPTPATTWVSVEYTLPVGATSAILTLTSTLGVKVMEAELGGSQGSKVLDLRGLSAGVYGYAVRCNGYMENGKLIIAR